MTETCHYETHTYIHTHTRNYVIVFLSKDWLWRKRQKNEKERERERKKKREICILYGIYTYDKSDGSLTRWFSGNEPSTRNLTKYTLASDRVRVW